MYKYITFYCAGNLNIVVEWWRRWRRLWRHSYCSTTVNNGNRLKVAGKTANLFFFGVADEVSETKSTIDSETNRNRIQSKVWDVFAGKCRLEAKAGGKRYEEKRKAINVFSKSGEQRKMSH